MYLVGCCRWGAGRDMPGDEAAQAISNTNSSLSRASRLLQRLCIEVHRAASRHSTRREGTCSNAANGTAKVLNVEETGHPSRSSPALDLASNTWGYYYRLLSWSVGSEIIPTCSPDSRSPGAHSKMFAATKPALDAACRRIGQALDLASNTWDSIAATAVNPSLQKPNQASNSDLSRLRFLSKSHRAVSDPENKATTAYLQRYTLWRCRRYRERWKLLNDDRPFPGIQNNEKKRPSAKIRNPKSEIRTTSGGCHRRVSQPAVRPSVNHVSVTVHHHEHKVAPGRGWPYGTKAGIRPETKWRGTAGRTRAGTRRVHAGRVAESILLPKVKLLPEEMG